MEAFHAPPAAVMPPVHHDPNTAGRISLVHRCRVSRWNARVASRRSSGMAEAPAITLNRMYHCVPSDMSGMLPQLMSICQAMNHSVTNGNVKFEGKLANTCASGCTNQEIRGFMPIFTPVGT